MKIQILRVSYLPTEAHRVLVKLPKHSLPVRGTSSRPSLTATLLTLYYFPSVGSKACPLSFGSSSLPETDWGEAHNHKHTGGNCKCLSRYLVRKAIWVPGVNNFSPAQTPRLQSLTKSRTANLGHSPLSLQNVSPISAGLFGAGKVCVHLESAPWCLVIAVD